MLSSLYRLPANRVRRNYRGGLMLERLSGKRQGCDDDRPEDWIASTVLARNPGLPPIPGEGISMAIDARGNHTPLDTLLRRDPVHFLGVNTAEPTSVEIGFLAKLLDAGMRLHVQAHPTPAFARRHLGSRWGKLETYVILGVRPECEGYIRLGFQHPPSPHKWRRIVMEQDIPAMDACFERIPVSPGEVWLVPGGLPHAIGEGLLVMEIMEPSDLVVRCEFERLGITVPPEARFMGRDPDMALKIFDFTPFSRDAIRERYRIEPRCFHNRPAYRGEILIDAEQTDCFQVRRHRFSGTGELRLEGKTLRVCTPVAGHGRVRVDDEDIPVQPAGHFLIAAAAARCEVIPNPGETLEIIECRPGSTDRSPP